MTPQSIQCEQFIPHPPAAVWRALTEPEVLARWWAPGDVRAEVGHRFTLDMGPWGHQVCEVLAVDEERMLRYSFGEGVLDSTITWRLEPEGSGTRLFLTHDGFDADSHLGRQALDGMGQGWPGVLTRIAPALTVDAR